MSTAIPPVPGAGTQRAEAGQQLGRAFKGAMAAVRRLRGRETHQPDELSDAQYSALYCLRTAEAMSSGEIAVAADVSAASATEMLEGLARAGLVERVRSDRDRRVVLSSLTERGRELVEARHARFQPRFEAALADFSPEEMQTAAAVLEALGAMFEDLARERTMGLPPAER
ncbi:MAG: MarR family transcriptional regulator, organic hydroperoxide resistance regulator [Solirubrobacteraceae bacterium]|jgi:DNA-binding MarR family transcriptional regulator|nr:MarR family transcriptional regulator, organic hydroperoxide resistance regulator [Solirubrobacteraceae bacterium]